MRAQADPGRDGGKVDNSADLRAAGRGRTSRKRGLELWSYGEVRKFKDLKGVKKVEAWMGTPSFDHVEGPEVFAW